MGGGSGGGGAAGLGVGHRFRLTLLPQLRCLHGDLHGQAVEGLDFERITCEHIPTTRTHSQSQYLTGDGEEAARSVLGVAGEGAGAAPQLLCVTSEETVMQLFLGLGVTNEETLVLFFGPQNLKPPFWGP